MKNLKNKALVLFLAMSIVGSASIFTVYAEPEIYAGESEVVVDPGNDSDVTIDTPVVEDPLTPDISDTPVTPPADTPQEPNVSDTPSYNDTPSYEDNDSSYTPDVNDNINQDSSSQINYDANYYNDMYNNGYYDSNETYYDNSWVVEDTYDPNMSFDEFEKATDYESATAATVNTVDMYNSNGSTSNTLSKDDWAEITLNFDETSVNSSDDFSFIKDNDTNFDSNLSILLLVLGIVLVAGSLSLITYMIVSKVRRSKTFSHTYTSLNTNHQTEQTNFVYDTTEIDVSQYADKYDK
ncbi:MAG: hypothetical protein UH239_01575 [Acutalibacteraceae bacterium]|nr:hypothetical protein [Acutalibacteraceae bacterium]